MNPKLGKKLGPAKRQLATYDLGLQARALSVPSERCFREGFAFWSFPFHHRTRNNQLSWHSCTIGRQVWHRRISVEDQDQILSVRVALLTFALTIFRFLLDDKQNRRRDIKKRDVG